MVPYCCEAAPPAAAARTLLCAPTTASTSRAASLVNCSKLGHLLSEAAPAVAHTLLVCAPTAAWSTSKAASLVNCSKRRSPLLSGIPATYRRRRRSLPSFLLLPAAGANLHCGFLGGGLSRSQVVVGPSSGIANGALSEETAVGVEKEEKEELEENCRLETSSERLGWLGGGETDLLAGRSGRREALVLGVLPAAAALACLGWCTHPAQALIQTGREKEAAKAAGVALEALKRRVSTFTLRNGMRWIVLQRHNAPVVACHTYADVGAANEVTGVTGIAHLLEHLAFKGTKIVGTKDAAKEATLLEQLDDVFYALRDAKKAGRKRDVDQLSKKFANLQAMAAQLSIPNEYGALLSRQGGVGLNAQTSQDETEYFVSLPANKLELWMALESGRFIAPVFRELYSEKEVVKEERRLRVENTPFGKFTEAFTETAFPDQPYGRPIIGYPSDFELIGRREVTSFFQQHYSPTSLTCAVVGDVDPTEVERLASRYFGQWEGASDKKHVIVPAAWRNQSGWNQIVHLSNRPIVEMRLPAQPLYMEGYYRPPASSTDAPTISVLNELLTGGRGSRFYKNIIVPGKALSAETVETFPGEKQPCLFLLYAYPPSGASTSYIAGVLHQELEKIASNQVSSDELVPVKKAARVGLLEALGNNQGMAKLLCQYEATTGDWANLLTDSAAVEEVTPAQVQSCASLLFQQDNRITGHVETSLSSST
ncbi:unnamed protein product [Sphagnum compactum]